MAVQPYTVRDENDDEVIGAVLVCTTTGAPLPVPPKQFVDVDDALEFEQWAMRRHGVRDLRVEGYELRRLACLWNDGGREEWETKGEPCDT